MTTGNPIFRGCASNERAGSCAKLDVHDWLKDISNTNNPDEFVEIRFKNTRKDYYRNVNQLKLIVGELVAVEGNPGHDIGMVSLTGDLVVRQMKHHKVTLVNGEMRKVYRKAKPVDIEKWELAMKREHETMIKSRQLAVDLELRMKIGDVEYQGDGTKAIFYYIADERVDFRQLIKVLAETFHIRIEMKQIGARQEAGRIGGIGPCGRELCCCSWMTNFSSVTTVAARYQEISLNPQKLAGQCSKLKCCLNYEVDNYIDSQKYFPPKEKLQTQEGDYNFIKTDVLKKIYWYTHDSKGPTAFISVPVQRVKSILNMNSRGKKPEVLIEEVEIDTSLEKKEHEYGNVVGQDSLTRFDKPKEVNRKNKRFNKRRRPVNKNQGENTDQNKKQVKASGNRRNNNKPNENKNRRPRKKGPNRPKQENKD
ncbi:MAG: regulatory iron-sulfur-containing complex subunit RicT [Prolixibacteraceae bacterium]|jgi:cell fate regulator YaaT (PSP1 superfamily)|nr:regulatory iron-sulfur-containing complex subunit RicT [Prolixibacteraceae bacterium]